MAPTLVPDPAPLPPGRKLCITCGPERGPLPLDAFYRMHKGDEARQSRCKQCDNAVRAKGIAAVEGRKPKRQRDVGPILHQHGAGVREYGGSGNGSQAFGDHAIYKKSEREQLALERWSNEVAAIYWDSRREHTIDGVKLPPRTPVSLEEACRLAALPMPMGEEEDPPVNLTTREKRPSAFDFMFATPPERRSEPPQAYVERMIPIERHIVDDDELLVDPVMVLDPEQASRGPVPIQHHEGRKAGVRSGRLGAASGQGQAQLQPRVAHRDPSPAASRARLTAVPRKQRVCRGCTHDEGMHGTGVCCRCGCERFRPILTPSERRAQDAKYDAALGVGEDAELARCPWPAPRSGRPCGKPAIHAGLCVVHGQRRDHGIAMPTVKPRTACERGQCSSATCRAGHRDLKPDNNVPAHGDPGAHPGDAGAV